MTLWYCSNSAKGNHDGTDWDNAWSLAQIVWGVGGVVAGDTLYVDGGSGSLTYTATANSMLQIGASGSNDSTRITIATGAKSPSPTNHDGQVIFDGVETYAPVIDVNIKNWITIDGEKSGTRNWVVKNADIGSGQTAPACVDATPSMSGNHTGVKITYLEIDNAGVGYRDWYASAREISYCYIHGIYAETCIQIIGNYGTETWGSSSVHHCTINPMFKSTSYGYGADGVQASSYVDYYNNTFFGVPSADADILGGQHCDHIQHLGSYLRAYNNTFYTWGNSAIISDFGGYFKIYNNILGPATGSGGCGIQLHIEGNNRTDLLIANNTFIDQTNYPALDFYFNGGNWTGISAWEIKNNIFYNTGKPGNYTPIQANMGAYTGVYTAGDIDSGADAIVDYNLVNAGAHGLIGIKIPDGTTLVQAYGQSGAPSFVTYVEYATNNDFHLQSGDTAARGNGIDLSAHFTTDKGGDTRSTWDIGAYEYGSPLRTLFRP